MRVYLAGPMRGQPGCGFPAFDAARDLLIRLGHQPVSPADMDRAVGFDGTGDPPDGFTQRAMRRDVEAILSCDAVAFLPGWESSKGARAERVVAESIGLPSYRVDATTFYRESVIGICGYARAGKDTLARIIADLGYEHRSFAGPMKPMLYALDPTVRLETGFGTVSQLVDAFGWEAAKTHDEVRRLLQRLGTEAGRAHLGQDVWVNALFAASSSGRLVISDCRFPNEADAIRAKGGVVVRVERPGVRPVNRHTSETALDDYEPDLVVANDETIDDLRPWAHKAVSLAEHRS